MAAVEVITTSLEMVARPSLVVTRPNRSGMLLRLQEPTVHFYRYLYGVIGARWGWTERSAMGDEELRGVITDELVEIFVLYMSGVPAGSFELDRRVDGEVELRHFGLVSDFIGRGLGKHLLASAVDAAWDHEPDRVWVRSTNLEHPRGLLTYQWAGFEPFESSWETREDPRRPE